MTSENAWEIHYNRNKSILHYPDENLVRLLKLYIAERNPENKRALDAGCGTGRHLKLLHELGFGYTVGIDLSENALVTCGKILQQPVIRANLDRIPFHDGSFDIVVSWGSLHYNSKQETNILIGEIHRVLAEGGRLMGTLRNHRDTYLTRKTHMGDNTWVVDTSDIRNSVVSFYEEEEIRHILGRFSDSRYGVMERTPPGSINKVLSHWYFWAEK